MQLDGFQGHLGGRETSNQGVHLWTLKDPRHQEYLHSGNQPVVHHRGEVRLNHPFRTLIDAPRLKEPQRIDVDPLDERSPMGRDVKQLTRNTGLPDTGHTPE
jgi:hypothetical protein